MRYRMDVAENPTADVEALAALAHDVEPRVRSVYAVLPGEFGRRVPDGVAEVLARDSSAKVRRGVAGRPELSRATQDRLLRDEDPGVRARVLGPGLWERLAEPVRERLRADTSPEVRAALTELCRVEPAPETLPAEARVRHTDPRVRREAAADPSVPLSLALRLADDPDGAVRLALSLREDLTEEQRASVRHEDEVPDAIPCPPWIRRGATDPATARRIAASAHVGLRRALAAQPRLPADVVARLAADEDSGVRRALCDFCTDAPHALLLERHATAQDRNWSAARLHRNFAVPGLARYADDPNPRLRRAALDDPDAGPELVLRLADDPEVTEWAVRDPRLAAAELLRRLTLPHSASAAAGNPALPPKAMHRLIDLAQSRWATEDQAERGHDAGAAQAWSVEG
ncbi:hypothetical protein ABZS76_26765 [Streptomyces sp. NPDC005562]|uniref:hypothetical protein n=1 Tax=unclassified Streptomyces TaxID=2593676 RepID=UPI0033BE928E